MYKDHILISIQILHDRCLSFNLSNRLFSKLLPKCWRLRMRPSASLYWVYTRKMSEEIPQPTRGRRACPQLALEVTLLKTFHRKSGKTPRCTHLHFIWLQALKTPAPSPQSATVPWHPVSPPKSKVPSTTLKRSTNGVQNVKVITEGLHTWSHPGLSRTVRTAIQAGRCCCTRRGTRREGSCCHLGLLSFRAAQPTFREDLFSLTS